MAWRLRTVLAGLAIWGAGQALAANPAAETEVRAALEAWTGDFNAARADRVCDLFAPDLRYDYRGFPTRGREDLCALLRRSLADPTRRFNYRLDIADMVSSGDLVAVRLVWTLTVRAGGTVVQTREPGLDVFRRESDGRWLIVRFLAYEEP